jgi:hypothetical protein
MLNDIYWFNNTTGMNQLKVFNNELVRARKLTKTVFGVLLFMDQKHGP